MKRVMWVFVAALVVVSCATTSPRSQDLVSRAVQAMGGAETLAAITTIAVKGSVRQWEPEQSVVAGGDMRYACESTFDAITDVGARTTRIDWVRNFAYPAPRTYTFSEIVTPEAGYIAGIDSNGRTKQRLDSNPPAHSMSGMRLANTQSERQRGSTLLLLEMLRNSERVAAVGAVTVGSLVYPAAAYRAGNQTL